MAKYTNTGKGPRGITLQNGDVLFLDKGEEYEMDKAEAKKVHGDIKVDDEGDETDAELATLKAEAEELGIKVDGRWKADRIAAEIEAAKTKD